VNTAERSARDAILAAVRESRPPAVARAESPEPAVSVAGAGERSRTDAFTAAAIASGADVTVCARADVARVVEAALAGSRSVLSFSDFAPSRDCPPGDLRGLAALEVLVCDTTLGVAENGAVWIASSNDRLRAALFLAARVVVLLSEEDLVDDLHAAYARIDVRAHPFGAFVAGPSKTADIEQALVIGAHGPKALALVVVRA
jgi:L-lactate dehydrogenase complex protein LldG